MKSTFRLRKLSLLSAVCLVAATLLPAAELKLAENGKTDYQIIPPQKPSSLEKEAVRDFHSIMKKISGANFKKGKNKSRSIFIGVVPPTDKKPLAEGERRITSYKGDIYIYGEGDRGNTNAIYDFLRTYLNCRWYNAFGDNKIPRQKNITLNEIKFALIPSFPAPMTANNVSNTTRTRDFARRNNLVDRNLFLTGGKLGTHAGQSIVPSGLVATGKRIGNTFGPFACLKDKAYFKDHPEFFSMNAKGKRNIRMQLCYSNKKMRNEFEKNSEIILKSIGYTGNLRLMGIGQDDNGGKFCYCDDCAALEKKYDHPAGAYYDFLLDMSKRFAVKHPKLKLLFLAYRNNQTLYPSKKFTRLPENLMVSFAPLSVDYTKPLSHPNNKVALENFKRWTDIATSIQWWSYPTPYPRPIVSYPLIANINRIAENFRIAHKHNVWMTYSQFGSGAYSALGLNDLRCYLLLELTRDINSDVDAITREYYEATVGKAAPLMVKFIKELEKEEAATTSYLSWNPDILRLDYLTADNLLRWTEYFDEMEKLVKKRQLLNVRRARYFLDQNIIARWPYMTEAEQKRFGDPEKIIARAVKTVKDDISQAYSDLRKSRMARYNHILKSRTKYIYSGLNQYIARLRGGKELPEKLQSRGKLYRIMPNRNKEPLFSDPDAAFGLCNYGQIPHKSEIWLGVRTFDLKRDPQWLTGRMPKPLNLKRVKKEKLDDGKYHYVHLGAAPLTRICVMNLSSICRQSSIELSHLYEPDRPNRLFDFYVQISIDTKKNKVKIGELVVIPLDKDASGKSKKLKRAEDNMDDYV